MIVDNDSNRENCKLTAGLAKSTFSTALPPLAAALAGSKLSASWSNIFFRYPYEVIYEQNVVTQQLISANFLSLSFGVLPLTQNQSVRNSYDLGVTS